MTSNRKTEPPLPHLVGRTLPTPDERTARAALGISLGANLLSALLFVGGTHRGGQALGIREDATRRMLIDSSLFANLMSVVAVMGFLFAGHLFRTKTGQWAAGICFWWMALRELLLLLKV